MLKVGHACMRRWLDTRVPIEGFTVHLFQNDFDVDRNTEVTDLVESDFDGYLPQSPAWIPAVQSGAEDTALAPALTFAAEPTQAIPQLCYGYYVLNTDDEWAWGETFEDGPFTFTLAGNELRIFPQISDRNFGD